MTREEKISHLLSKAHESVRGAEILLSENMPDFCASRAYYAMFYVAEALLLTKGLEFSKHSGVIASFNKEFVNAGIFPESMHKTLRRAFDYRTQGDYGIVPLSDEEAKEILQSAVDFIETIEGHLKKEGFLKA